MLYNVLHVFVLHSVSYVPEVLAVRKYLLVIFFRHKLHESFISLQNRPELFHAELIVARYFNVLHICKRKQLLLFPQNSLEKVFVDHHSRWYVELDYTEN